MDLSKIKRDSDDESEHKPKGMTEQEYLEYLENRSQVSDSQESYLRHEELKERKNKILMLLNGEMDEDEDMGEEAEEESEEDESIEVIGQLDGDGQEFLNGQVEHIDSSLSPEIRKMRRAGSEGDL